MPIPPATPAPQQTPNYGAASKYDFDNPQKWHTVQQVPLLKEHTLTNQKGADVGEVNRQILQEIAANNNRRVFETGDPAPGIIGHTSDDPQAPEKPVKAFFVNYTVKPFQRDPETGRVIYAIHGDLKIRHHNKHILEEYPRRSVELWLGKREIDPVAFLGGTTQEQDLGLLIRHSRLQAVAFLGGTTPNQDLSSVVRYDRKHHGTVYDYVVDDPWRYAMGEHPVTTGVRYAEGGKGGKFGKVMSEFKHGTLHSGSKHGPKVTSRDQAKAIAASEAGISKNARGEPDMFDQPPGHMNYEADNGPPTDDLPPDEDGMGDEGGGGEEDPEVAKVFASRQWQQMQADIQEIKDAILGAGEGAGAAPPDGGLGGGPPPEGGMGGEMPPGPPEGGEMPPGHPDEEAAMFHGDNPVRFDYSSTSFAGPTDTFVSGVGGHSVHHGGHTPKGPHKMNRTPTRPAPRGQQQRGPQSQDEVVRLKRTVAGMAQKLARAEAEKTINALEQEGILFHDKEAEINYFAALDPAGQKIQVEQVYRVNYRRRESDPANPAYPGVARYSAPTSQDPTAEDYEPTSPADAVNFANLQTEGKMTREQAVKFMRSRNGQARR